MLDLVKYQYHTLDLPNIQAVLDIDQDATGWTFEIEPRLKPLIIEAAMKFPMWQFYAGGAATGLWRYEHDKKLKAHRFTVWDGQERLGELSTATRNNGDQVYAISNNRIARKRERGVADMTKDIKKAIKIISKSFGSKTVSERISEAMMICESNIDTVVRTKVMEFNEPYRIVARGMADHMIANWETTRSILVDKGVNVDKLGDVPELYEQYKVAEETEACYKNKKGVVVIIHGSDYVVKNLSAGEGSDITLYDTDNLPEWIKRGVGMLKLVDKNTMLGGIGFKIDGSKFYVIGVANG
jgi:hypothetical protein